MRITTALSSLTLMTVVGCTPQPAIDLDAERNAIMSADRAWAEAYAASDSPADAFVAQLTDDATLLPPDAPLAQGTEAIHAVISELEAMPGFSVTWGPDMAEVGSGGDLGFTIGNYQMQMEGPEGPMSIDGKYLTVWKKQLDGTWMVIADMFNAVGPPTMPM
jgi:ketosteroid isomerase-like protein